MRLQATAPVLDTSTVEGVESRGPTRGEGEALLTRLPARVCLGGEIRTHERRVMSLNLIVPARPPTFVSMLGTAAEQPPGTRAAAIVPSGADRFACPFV